MALITCQVSGPKDGQVDTDRFGILVPYNVTKIGRIANVTVWRMGGEKHEEMNRQMKREGIFILN